MTFYYRYFKIPKPLLSLSPSLKEFSLFLDLSSRDMDSHSEGVRGLSRR